MLRLLSLCQLANALALRLVHGPVRFLVCDSAVLGRLAHGAQLELVLVASRVAFGQRAAMRLPDLVVGGSVGRIEAQGFRRVRDRPVGIAAIQIGSGPTKVGQRIV